MSVARILAATKNESKKSDELGSSAIVVGSNELCDLCDDVTAELHKLISDSLVLPEFDSDLVEEMNKGIASSWLAALRCIQLRNCDHQYVKKRSKFFEF